MDRAHPVRLGVALLAAAAIIAQDLTLAQWDGWLRAAPAALALGLYGLLGGFDPAALRLRLRPLPHARYWIKATAVAGLIVAAGSGLIIAGLHLAGYDVSPGQMFTDGDQIAPMLWSACVEAPLVEESLYRFVLCTPLFAAVGRWPTIVIGGAVFGALHFVYGNPGPDNFVAGYVLTWAYWKSGSLLVPIALHALGNLCVVGMYAGLYLYG